MKEDKADNQTAIKLPLEAEEILAVEGSGKVGSLLKEMRLQKSLNLPDVSKKLCIRKVYLEAIEESQYDQIPEYPYGIGFIRSYADFLGLNSVRIIQMYKDETEANQDKNKNYFVPEPQMEATVPGKKYLLISLIALFVVYFVWYSFNKPQSQEQAQNVTASDSLPADEATDLPLVVEDYAVSSDSLEANSPKTIEEPLAVIEADALPVADGTQVVVTDKSFVEPTAKVEVKEAKPEVKVEPKAETPEAVNAAKIDSRILIKVKKETWIEVKDGQKLYLSKVLQPGESYAVPATSGVILSVGKYDGVDVLVDGRLTPVVKNDKKMNINLDSFLTPANR